MHQVAVGSPAELAGFLVALDEDKHLAMDFWAVMGKMSEEGSAYLAGSPLHERMLEVVVEAVTGLNVAEVITSSEESLGTVERLSRLLGGEDLNSPVVIDDAPAIEPDVEGKKPVGRAEMPSLTAVPSPPGGAGPLRLFRSRAEEPERAPVEIRPVQRAEERIAAVQPIARAPDAGPRPFAAKPAIAPAVPSPPDEQALERLRLMHWALQNFPANSGAQAEAELLAAKLNAADILAKYAPPPPRVAESGPAVKAPVVAAAGSGVVLGPALARVPEPVLVQSDDENGRLTYMPEAASPGLDLGPQHNHAQAHIPLSDYAAEFEDPETNQRIRIFKLVFAWVVSLGVVIGLLLAHFHGGFWQTVASSLQQMRGTFAQRAEPSLNFPNDLVVDPPPVELPPSAPIRRLVRPLPRPPVPAFQARATSTKDLRTDAPIVRVYPSFSVRNDPAPAAAATPSAPAGASSSDATLSPGGTGPLPVPGSVMAENLLISRLPQYPDEPGTRRASGRVVMQAVINKDGTIGHLRVIEGDPALRNAALDAVSKWRYKPYTVNGQPVDVSTTVAVDFRQDQ